MSKERIQALDAGARRKWHLIFDVQSLQNSFLKTLAVLELIIYLPTYLRKMSPQHAFIVR